MERKLPKFVFFLYCNIVRIYISIDIEGGGSRYCKAAQFRPQAKVIYKPGQLNIKKKERRTYSVGVGKQRLLFVPRIGGTYIMGEKYLQHGLGM